MTGVSGEVLAAHDLLVGVFVDGFLHPVEITLELLLRRLPPTLEEILAVVGVDRGCSRHLSPARLPRNGRVLLVERDVVVEDGAVCDLPTAVNKSIRTSTADSGAAGRRVPGRDEDTSPHTPALIVAPAIDAQYRAGDTLGETHAKTLQARTLARLATFAEGYDIPVLVTRNERNEFTEPVATVADHRLECKQTRMGPRVVGEDFETLVYPVDDGAYYQTTFAYWQQLLAARATQVGVEPTTPAPSTPTPEGVGTGVTAVGETVAATADPLLDAWTATGTGGR